MTEETEFNKFGERFGGKVWADIGLSIASEGPGKGFASYPWALDEYERALGITPHETWLLKRMIKHVWKNGGLVFISMRKVCEEALISRTTLDKNIKSLLKKGYILAVERGRKMDDRRVRYDVSGVFNALAIAISMNPASKTIQICGPIPLSNFFKSPPKEWEDYTGPFQINNYYHARGQRFNWCIGRTEPLETDKNGTAYKVICEKCEADFVAKSSNAKYCPACKEIARQERWEAFKQIYGEFEEAMQGE